MASSLEEETVFLQDDYYSLLNVHKEASKEEINLAYRRLSKVYHPDKHLDPTKKKDAEALFSKLKKAHEVLIDEHKRTVYDLYGEKGLETYGKEVISRTKTPAEIIAEYERFQREQEERQLQQRTNPKGIVMVGLDLTDYFEADYPRPSPHMDLMKISQSVECPLTSRDTVILAGNVSMHNHGEMGMFMLTWRRLFSNMGWVETEMHMANRGLGASVKFTKQLTKRCMVTAGGAVSNRGSGSMALMPTVLGLVFQFDNNLQGRMSLNMMGGSALSIAMVHTTEKQTVLFSIQLSPSPSSSFLFTSYTRSFPDIDGKGKLAFKATLDGDILFEYGFEKRITNFSNLGATMSVGVPSGITIKIRLVRGQQRFVFPIKLTESQDIVNMSALFYGTVIPLTAYFAIKKLIVAPFLKDQKEKEIEKTRQEHAEKMAKRKHEAEATVELMRETVERTIEIEERKMGLVIVKALYGKLTIDNGDLIERECIDVTVPLQVLVKESKLILENTSKSSLPGFYDPCIGEDKTLLIRYKFHNKLHQCTVDDTDFVRLPQQKHRLKEDV